MISDEKTELQSRLVTVIIPLYNHERFIRQAIDSVFQQTHPNIELIVVDDGSTDRSADVAKAAIHEQPTRMAKLIRQKNRGPHEAMNAGLAAAKGDFLTLLNSDDFYHPERLSTCLAEMEKFNAGCSFSYIYFVDENGQPLDITHPYRQAYETQVMGEPSAVSISASLLSANLAMSSGNIILSRKLYERVGGFRSYELAHDWDFLLRIASVCEPILVKKVLYYYRLHQTNTVYRTRHLIGVEAPRIYAEYLEKVATSRLENETAPSFKTWPYGFAALQHRTLMLQTLRGFVERPTAAAIHFEPMPKSFRKTVTIFVHEFGLTGAPRLAADIAFQLRSRGYKVRLIGLKGGPLRTELTARGIPNHVLLLTLQPTLRRVLLVLGLLVALPFVRGTVLMNTAVTLQALMYLARLLPKRKLILYIHEAIPPSTLGLNEWERKQLSRVQGRKNFQVWFGSKSTAEYWAAEGFHGEIRYWSGLSRTSAKAKSQPIKTILTVGTVDPRKGIHYILEAFVKCAHSGRIPADVHLTIVGFSDHTHDYELDIIWRVLASGIKDRIRLVGLLQKPALDEFYDKADLYIHAALMESMPLAILNMMARGTPIITTAIDGCIEAIPDNSAGWLCPPRNVDALADALAAAVNDPKEAYRRGRTAKDRFDKLFSLEATADRVLNELVD